MREQDNDRLEEFFRKAVAGPDVTFNEEDWKKLETRLDQKSAADAAKTAGRKLAAAIFIASVAIFSGGLWLGSRYPIIERAPEVSSPSAPGDPNETGRQPSADLPSSEAYEKADNDAQETRDTDSDRQENVSSREGARVHERTAGINLRATGTTRSRTTGIFRGGTHARPLSAMEAKNLAAISDLGEEKIDREWIGISPAIAVKTKQKAVVDLPGAEEEGTSEAKADVKKERASVQKRHLAMPRLSLLLFFAPDFSGTSLDMYGGPGKAFGAMLHYHVGSRWSVSSGVIKNYKKYRGSGEYYKPPQGYWKRNTNGIVPSTIDGSCSILEFPLMIEYTITSSEKNKWIVGAGASSYLMQTESYRYNFEEPNPGSMRGWHSKNSSRFLFNMLNFTVGFEHELLPGLMMGIEPYIKIPVEEIGWSNLKLFSSGASMTVRYNLIGKGNLFVPRQNRPPD